MFLGHIFSQTDLVESVFERNFRLVHFLVVSIDVNNFLFVLVIVVDHYVRQKGLFVEFHVHFPWLWEQCVLELAFLSLSLGVCVVTDDTLDDLFAFDRQLFRPEQLDSDPLAKGVKILIEEKFLHFFIYRRKLISEDDLHNFLVRFCRNVNTRVFDHVNENLPEGNVNFLGVDGHCVDERTNYLLVFWFVVPTEKWHFGNNSEDHFEEPNVIKKHFHVFSDRHWTLFLGILVELIRKTEFLQKHMAGF